MSESKLKLAAEYGSSCCQNSREFYLGRIRFIMDNHNFRQREQLLGMVLSAAMSDRSLSVSDLLYVVNQVELSHQKTLEENWNEELAW